MEKAYNKITWKNQPSTATPLGERLLNAQSNSIDEMDNRIIALDTEKLSVEVANGMVKSFNLDEKSGVITVTLLDGTVQTWDLNIEKIPVSLAMDENAVLIFTTADGETYTADLKKLIDTYIFVDSETVAFNMTSENDGKHVTAIVKDGSITEDKLQPKFLSDMQTTLAEITQQADKSEDNALMSQSYAVGGSGAREGEDTDNSKYYCETAKNYMEAAQTAANIIVPMFYIDFTTGCLMSETASQGIQFTIENGYFIGEEGK